MPILFHVERNNLFNTQCIMRQSLIDLIEVAFDVKVYFGVSSYELHQYDDGSYVDFLVQKIPDVKRLLSLANGLDMRILYDERGIIVRLSENYVE